MFVASHVARETADYILELEEWHEGVLVHFRVSRFSPTVLKQMKREWQLFRRAVTCPLFVIEPPGSDDKWRHFVTSFGFKPHMHIPCTTGESCQMYIHRNDGPEFTIHTIDYPVCPVG